MSCQEAHPEFCGDITWNKLVKPLILWPICVQVGITLVFIPILRGLWVLSERGQWNCTRVKKFFTGDIFVAALSVIEISISLGFAIQWIRNSRDRHVTELQVDMEFALCTMLILLYVIQAARTGFRLTFSLHLSSFITVFTALPCFWRTRDLNQRWFSWGYLRIYNALKAYREVKEHTFLNDLSEVQQTYVQLCLDTVVFIIMCAGTMFNLEILGELDGFDDVSVTTNMGDISFFQMSYWIVTTVSTVGYGDYSPTTIPSRFFIIIVIVVGTVFFSIKVSTLFEGIQLDSSGHGRYVKVPWFLQHFVSQRKHVVLVGGGIKSVSTLLRPLLNELLAKAQEKGNVRWPNICFLSPAEKPEGLQQIIRDLPRKAQSRIQYFIGTALDFRDTERVSMADASMVIVVTDFHASDPDQEDYDNIMRALAIIRAYPSVNIRLVLLRERNKEKAVRVGIATHQCFSIGELKSALFAISCTCRGWSTMISNLLSSVPPENLAVNPEAWVSDYEKGCQARMRGFLVNADYLGCTFLDFARAAANTGVMPMGVQIKGQIELNPYSYILDEGDVIFAIVSDEKALAAVRSDMGGAWREEFLKDRNDQAKTSVFLKKKGEANSRSVANVKSMKSFKLTTPGRFLGEQLYTGEVSKLPFALDAGSQVEFTAQATSVLNGAEAVAKDGGHFIVVMTTGAPWSQVNSFLRVLHGEHLPFHVRCIILVPESAVEDAILELDREHVQSGDRVIWFRDKPEICNLMDAGLLNSRGVVLLAGNAGQASDGFIPDSIGVTLLSAIEYELSKHSGRISKLPYIPVMLELHSQDSTCCMSRFPAGEETNLRCSQLIKVEPLPFVSHPRFADGGIYAADTLGMLLAQAFYTPGILELLEALVLVHSSDKDMHPWQVAIPEEIKVYGDLVQYCLDQKEPALCLGLYRKCFPEMEASSARYVVTNPDPNTDLLPCDLAIVMAGVTFGRDAFKNNLLVSALGAKPREEVEKERHHDEQEREVACEALRQVARDQGLAPAGKAEPIKTVAVSDQRMVEAPVAVSMPNEVKEVT